MTDVRTLLSQAAGTADVTDDTVAADLVRARRGLRRRTALRVTGSVVTGTALVAAVVVVRSGAESRRPVAEPPHRPVVTTPAAPRTTTSAPATNLRAVTLVAYTGRQPSGYEVAYVPKGWEVQGANEFRLTIAPIGTTDTHPDAFEGKLVVLLRSKDDTGPPIGTPIPVGNGTGYLNRTDPATAVLMFQDSAKHWVLVQVPRVLGWSDRDIARFGAGVEVTHDAQAGVG
jgi:hypothetical protein